MTHKKLPAIRGFIENSCSDWPNKVCAVLFLGGCNFRCPYCHNHQLVLDPKEVPEIPWASVMDRVSSLSSWLDGVCISGGEPTLVKYEKLAQLCAAFKHAGFQVKLDTNGTRPDVVAKLWKDELIDFVAMDIKAPLDNPELYVKSTGVEEVNLDAVNKTFSFLNQQQLPRQFRTTWHPALFSKDTLNFLVEQVQAVSGTELKIQHAVPDNALADWFRELKPYQP